MIQAQRSKQQPHNLARRPLRVFHRDFRHDQKWPARIRAKSITRILRLSNRASVLSGDQITQTTTGAAINGWQTKADKALVTIITNCEEKAQTLIEGCETPAEALAILKSHFKGRTRTHLSTLLLDIVNLKFDDRKTTVSGHLPYSKIIGTCSDQIQLGPLSSCRIAS